MPTPGSLALAVALALVGPPKLPPLPGERPPEPPPTTPTKPTPTKPAARPVTPTKPTARPVTPNAPAKPTGPAPQKAAPPPAPAEPTPAPSRSTVPPEAKAKPLPGPPVPSSPTTPPQFGPSVMEPPQPEAGGPAVEDPEPESEPKKKSSRRRSGAGEAPAMGAGELPGEEPDERPMLRFPPPVRPPYSGTGLLIGAGVAFSASLAEQIVAHVLVKRRCIEPFAASQQADPENPDEVRDEANDFAQALLGCAPGVLPAVALRVYSDFGLLTSIGLAAGGAAMRARQRAYDDVFASRSAAPMVGLRIGGASLIGVGVVTWLTTGALSWGLLASCRDAKCATRARLMAFTTRDTGAVLIAAGAGMLSYSFAHRRGYDRFLRERLLSVGTAYVPGGAGLSLSGRF